jgi:hypothetical protein
MILEREMNDKAVKNKVTLEVLNPRGALQSVPITGLSNPRIAELAGKKIALMSEKEESFHFFNALGELIKKRYPTAIVLHFDSPANPMRPDNTVEVAAQCDVWLQGVKTSGSSVVDYDVKMEKLGKPGVVFCIDSLLMQRKRLAEVNGMPTLRIAAIPAIQYLGAEGSIEKMKLVAASVFDDTLKALIVPLTDAEKNPAPFAYNYGPLKFSGTDYTQVMEKFQKYFVDNYLGDGLPLIPPTQEAVAWMLTGTNRSPNEEIGVMSPRNGIATIEKIAINAVMAGARPEYLPVIIAAIECITEKCFNLYHISTGTWWSTPLIWVNGPIAEEIGVNSGKGFLGQGFRANNTIGRTVNLCMINIGWRLMNTDVSFTGDSEGFCSFTFAENEKDSPWESFSVERGFRPEQSTVTVNETMMFNRSGPGGGMSSITPEQSLGMLIEMLDGQTRRIPLMRLGATNLTRFQIAIHPTFARQLADMGFNKQSLAQWLYNNTCLDWDQLNDDEKKQIVAVANAGKVPGLKPANCKHGLVFPLFSDPTHLAILVVGDPGGNTLAWSSPIGSTAPNADSPPGTKNIPFMTKVIHGATLTKAGR